MTSSSPLTSIGHGQLSYQPGPAGPVPVWTNWAATISTTGAEFYEPADAKQVQQLVQRALAENRRIRVVGSGHSWNSSFAVQSGDLLISTSKLNAIVGFDSKTLQFKVQPGVTVGQTTEFYRKTGVNLPFQVDSPNITIGGAVTVGATGFATRYAGYADAIVELELVDGSGKLRQESKAKTSALEWSALITSLGLLGVITSITLQLVKLVNIEVVDEKYSLSSDPLQNLEKIVQENQYAQFHWIPCTDTVLLHKANETKAPLSKGSALVYKFYNELIDAAGNIYANEIVNHEKLTAPALQAAAKALPRSTRFVIPASDDVLFVSTQHPFVDIGVFVRGKKNDLSNARRAWNDAIALVKKYQQKGQYPANFIMALRVLPESNALLQTPESSSNSPDDVRVHIQMISYRHDAVWHGFSTELLKTWFSYGGTTPHWSKEIDGQPWLYTSSQKTLGKNLERFLKVRHEWDPAQVFLNDFWAEVLNIPSKRLQIKQSGSTGPVLSAEYEQHYQETLPKKQDVSLFNSIISLLFLPLTLLVVYSPFLSDTFNWIKNFIYRLAWRLALADPPFYPRQVSVDTNSGVRLCPTPNFIDFVTADGLRLQLLHWHRNGAVAASSAAPGPRDDIAVIMHGLTTSSDMFIMPEHVNLVDYLLQNGFNDVFTVDNRISKRWYHNLEGNNFTVDHLAAYDNVAMIEALNKWSVQTYGHVQGIHIMAHCVNALSISCTAAAGLIKPAHQVRTIIINSTGLTPYVGFIARMKLYFVTPVAARLFSYLSPKFIREPYWDLRKVLGYLVSLFHWECEVPECHFVSFIWFFGFPGVWRHEQLDAVTHERAGDLYGAVSLHYDLHIRKCVHAGQMIKFKQSPDYFPELPNDYFKSALAGNLNTPLLMVTGEDNGVFYDSNIRFFNRLEEARANKTNFITSPYKLHVYKDYGHQDPFMGKNVATEVFPTFLEWIDRYSSPVVANL